MTENDILTILERPIIYKAFTTEEGFSRVTGSVTFAFSQSVNDSIEDPLLSDCDALRESLGENLILMLCRCAQKYRQYLARQTPNKRLLLEVFDSLGNRLCISECQDLGAILDLQDLRRLLSDVDNLETSKNQGDQNGKVTPQEG